MEWSLAAGDAEAARAIRHAITECLRAGAAARSDVDAAEIVVGELLSNVVLHTEQTARVSLEWEGTHPELRVTEHLIGAFALPAGALPRDPMATGGRGLYLVRRLARDVAVDTDDAQRTVKVTLDVARSR